MFIFLVVFVYIVVFIYLSKLYLIQLYEMFLVQLVVACCRRAQKFWPNCTTGGSYVLTKVRLSENSNSWFPFIVAYYNNLYKQTLPILDSGTDLYLWKYIVWFGFGNGFENHINSPINNNVPNLRTFSNGTGTCNFRKNERGSNRLRE